MLEAFAHEAALQMAPDADLRAPGAAVTVELCGQWEHAPPCSVAPHHSHTRRVGADALVRVLFVVEPERETEVRRRIDAALSAGPSRRRGRRGRRRPVAGARQPTQRRVPEETAHARRLMRT